MGLERENRNGETDRQTDSRQAGRQAVRQNSLHEPHLSLSLYSKKQHAFNSHIRPSQTWPAKDQVPFLPYIVDHTQQPSSQASKQASQKSNRHHINTKTAHNRNSSSDNTSMYLGTVAAEPSHPASNKTNNNNQQDGARANHKRKANHELRPPQTR